MLIGGDSDAASPAHDAGRPRHPGARAPSRAASPARRRRLLALGDASPGARADAGARACCRSLNLFWMSFYNVTWAGGQATLDAGRARPLSRALSADTLFRAGLVQHDRLRLRRGRPGRWCSASCWRSSVQPRHAAAASLYRAIFILPILIPGIVDRRDLEADAQLRFRPRQSGASALLGLRAAGLARRDRARRCSPSSSSTSGTGRRSASCCSSPDSNPCRRMSTRPRRSTARRRGRSSLHHACRMMVPDHPRHLRLPARSRLQGLRRGLSADRRRTGHGDRGGELHALPALLHARTASATARRCRSP